jgi:hypothetical protein
LQLIFVQEVHFQYAYMFHREQNDRLFARFDQ